jgi:hypothetical protein
MMNINKMILEFRSIWQSVVGRAIAGEQPDLGPSPQSAPESSELLQQLRTEHDVSIFAALAALHVNDHPLGA